MSTAAALIPSQGTFTLASLPRLSYVQLDNLFRNAAPGDIPSGNSQGRALILPGTLKAGSIKTVHRTRLFHDIPCRPLDPR
jgi:hypothetical protein